MDEPPAIPESMQFHYVKSRAHRTIHADGAYGGISPQGRYVNVTFYSERSAIPRVTVHEIASDGKLLDELRDQREAREGVVRELETTIMLDFKAAAQLHRWLTEQLVLAKTTGVLPDDIRAHVHTDEATGTGVEGNGAS